MLLRFLLVLLACLFLGFAVTPAQAQQVQLTWDAPLQTNGTPVPNLAGYKLYYGSQSGQYPTMIPVGMKTTYTVTNLSAGRTYYFAAKAYNSTGMESAFSNEVSVTLPTNPPGGHNSPTSRCGSCPSTARNWWAKMVLRRMSSTATQPPSGIPNGTCARPAPPHSLVLDLGARYQVDGFRYLPRQDGSPNGTIAGYQFYVSDDGVTWGTAVAAGTLAANTSEKTVRFTAKTGRFVRLVALSEMNGNPWTSAAELNIFGAAAPSSTTTMSGLLAQSVTTSSVTSSASTSTTTVGKSTTPASPKTASQSNTKTAAATGSSLKSSASIPTMTVSQNTRWELTLTSTHTYANPFTDVTVTVEYTKAGSPPLQGYGFWDGGATFKLRQAFPEPGTWHYKTTATDPSNSGLHHREGDVQVLPYTGTNPLYRHGFLQVSADHRFLVHADGTPFLWLGDTLWDATVGLTEAGFHEAVADRRAKHLTVLQTNFAHQDEVDTAGDTPWQGDRWNVRFMQKLDRMFTDANDQGLYLFVNGLGDLVWDRGMPHAERLLEMIGARYAAHYVSFASSMDDPYEPLHEQIHAAIQRTAPRHLVTQHPEAATHGHRHRLDGRTVLRHPARRLRDACHRWRGGPGRGLSAGHRRVAAPVSPRAAETRGQWPSVVRRRRGRHGRNDRAARLSELPVRQRRLHVWHQPVECHGRRLTRLESGPWRHVYAVPL